MPILVYVWPMAIMVAVILIFGHAAHLHAKLSSWKMQTKDKEIRVNHN